MEIHAGIVMENICHNIQAWCHMAGWDWKGGEKLETNRSEDEREAGQKNMLQFG